MVGNIRKWKGQDVLVRAFAGLVGEHENLKCVFVGSETASDREFRLQLDRLVHQLGLADRVIFAGYRERVADYMNALDVVVHASVDPEPFGRVLIEAMALGKPVVAARAGAIPEIIDEPNCGLGFMPGDHSDLCSVLRILVSSSDRRLRIGNAGRRRARDEFNITRNVSETQKIYRELLL